MQSYPFKHRNLARLPGEQWRDIKVYEGIYQVSNMGRVRSLSRQVEIEMPHRGIMRYWTKELVLKQTIGKSSNAFLNEDRHHLRVSLHKDGVLTTLVVARLVYSVFSGIKRRLTSKIWVGHKDGDPFNNRFSNLVASSGRETGLSTYRNGRRISYFANIGTKERASYTRKAIEANHVQVTQYSLEGRRIAIYPSIEHAARRTGGNSTSICNALAGKYNTAAGYIWKKGKGRARINTQAAQLIEKNKHAHCRKPVIQYTVAGRKVRRYGSIQDAARRVGGSPRQISEAINGRSKSAYGFAWKVAK